MNRMGCLFSLPALILSVGFATHAKSVDGADKKAHQLIGQMVALQIISDQDLKNFDEELKSPQFDLMNSPSYLRLLATRSVLEGVEERIETYSAQPSFSKAIQNLVRETGSVSVSEMVKSHRQKLLSSGQLQMSAQTFSNLKSDVNIELASIKDAMNQRLIHYVSGGFQNITGSGFRKGVWALTYDDGPHRSRTQAILSLLKRHGKKATFFMLAEKAKANPSVVQAVLDAGMEVANHSYNHPNMAKLGTSSLSKQIYTSSDMIESMTGRPLRYFRLPYGSGQSKSTIRSMLADRGLIHVAWNVDSLDWKDKDPSSIYNRVASQMKAQGGGVILFHDIHQQTIKASELLLMAIDLGWISGDLMTVSEAR